MSQEVPELPPPVYLCAASAARVLEIDTPSNNPCVVGEMYFLHGTTWHMKMQVEAGNGPACNTKIVDTSGSNNAKLDISECLSVKDFLNARAQSAPACNISDSC